MEAMLAILALLLCAPAAAPSDAEVGRAKQHFQQGHVHYKAGRYAEAVREFEAANSIKPHPIFLYDMAQAYRMAADGRLPTVRLGPRLTRVPLDALRAQLAAQAGGAVAEVHGA